jgi:transmembrane protein EpsG
MIPYLLLFLFASVLYYSETENHKISNNILILFGLVVVCFIGFRDMIGGFDVYIYGEVYEAQTSFIITYEYFEKGFLYYFLLLKTFSEDRYFMFFVSAAITIGLHFFAIKQHSKMLFFSLFIYFCKFVLLDFVYIRQALAMCFIWISVTYVIKRKFIYFILLVIFAVYFHKSAILFLPMYFLYNRNLSIGAVLSLAATTFIIAVSPLSRIIFSRLSDVSDMEKVNVYLTTEDSSFNFFYLIEVVLIIYLMLKFKKQFNENTMSNFIFNGMFAYVLVSIIGINNATFVRFGWYFYIFIFIGLSYVYTFIETKKGKLLFKNLTFLYFGMLYLRFIIFVDSGANLIPYKTIFQDFDRHGKYEFMEYRK